MMTGGGDGGWGGETNLDYRCQYYEYEYEYFPENITKLCLRVGLSR